MADEEQRFGPVSSKVDFPKLEERVLEKWQAEGTFEEVDNVRAEAPLFVFYEGPPTANGSPGIHHVLSRSFKDVVLRYKTMQGFRPLRRGGWDTHGLPVELEIEKELGLQTKQEIERLLAKAGVRPRKRFGQNFLIDGNLMRRVAEVAELSPRDLILEVGAGTGGLTDLLAAGAGAGIGASFNAPIAGMLFALDYNSVSPSSFGNFFELYAIAAAVLGG